MRKSIFLTALLLLVISFSGCRKDSPQIENLADIERDYDSETYWEDLFMDFWNTTNQSYVFWLHDPLDWDAIKDEYLPKMQELDEWKNSDEESYDDYSESVVDGNGDLFCDGDLQGCRLFYQITQQLLDHHYGLKLKEFEFTLPGGSVEVLTRDYYHATSSATYFTGILDQYTLDAADGIASSGTAGVFYLEDSDSYLYMASYEIDDIAYLYFSSFYISSAIELTDEQRDELGLPVMSSIDDILLNFESIVKDNSDLKGAIIDVRGNGGGNAADLNEVYGPFINENDLIPFAYSRFKSGPNRLDYTDYTQEYLAGISSDATMNFPIAVLADVNSISMAEISCMAARAFSDQSVVVGERTFGATCPLTNDYSYGAGIVQNDNLYIYSSSYLFYDLNMNFYEGVGISPDIEVYFDASTWGSEDKQRDAAIAYLNSL